MAEIENIHCPICTQPIPSSWQNGLPPALATDERRGAHHLTISFFLFFVRLTLGYDYMCSKMDFTQEKSHFYPTTKIIPSFCLQPLCHEMVG